MGRRSRNRDPASAGRSPRAVTPAPAPAPAAERPRPPWHPVPLVELCVLIGLVLVVLGAVRLDERNGRLLVVLGMALASLGGLDTAVREHFAGFRSHSTLLAGLPAVVVAAALSFLRPPWAVVLVVAAAVFAAGFAALRNAFRRRSGGVSFKVR